jgi:hypothetical protein
MVNENVNVENGQCMQRLCECVLKMVNENAVMKLLMKMLRLCKCRKWSMSMFIFKKSYKFVTSYVVAASRFLAPNAKLHILYHACKTYTIDKYHVVYHCVFCFYIVL